METKITNSSSPLRELKTEEDGSQDSLFKASEWDNLNTGMVPADDKSLLKASDIRPDALSTKIPFQARSRVLKSQDLLDLIFQHFHCGLVDRVAFISGDANGTVQEPPGKHLIWGSLVCKAFFLPAMRVLWYEAPLLSILRLIPVLAKQDGVYNFTAVIQEEHFRRLDLYARCVRRLRITRFQERIASHVFTLISRLRHPVLTPALYALHIPSLKKMSAENLNSLFLLISPNLHAVGLYDIDQHTELLIASWLRELSLQAPSLQVLYLDGRLTQTTFDIIPGFKTLTSLKIEIQSSPLAEILKPCAEVKTLRTLKLSFDRKYVCPRSPAPVMCHFPTLTRLTICAPISAMANLLGTVSAPKLTSIYMTFNSGSQSARFDDSEMAACIEQCARNADSKISIMSLAGAVSIAISWKALLPLSEFSKLTRIRVKCKSLFMTDGHLLNFLGKGDWSRLQELSLVGMTTSPEDSTLTLLSLGIVAKHCTALSTFKTVLAIDTETQTLEALKIEIQSDTASLKSVTKLCIISYKSSPGEFDPGPNSIKGAAIVSRYIDHCFPAVKDIDLKHPGEKSGKWLEGVEEMIRNYQAMRSLRSI